MNRAVILSVLIIGGCNNNADNKKDFDACVERAEEKHKQAFNDICIIRQFDKPGTCSYNIQDHEVLVRSKDNEITACAMMYSPSK